MDDEDSHNPSEPTTTTCPLLPGQKLNVLEVPVETRSRSSSEVPGTFTRNPQDKFLTPMPPKPMPSPQLGDFCKEPYAVTMQAYSAPRSATLPSSGQLSASTLKRHARSASTSPQMSSTAVFCDFKGLKEKFAQKRAVHSRSHSARDLEIGAPTLISTTAEDMNLVPLAALQPLPASPYAITPPSPPSLVAPTSANRREFSPLGSHPVNKMDIAASRNQTKHVTRPRSRSHTAETTTQKILPKPNRAQSADAQNPRLFPTEPRMTSPKHSKLLHQEKMHRSTPAPTLQRPTISLEAPSADARPTSSYGGVRSPSLRKAPLDRDKKLPPLPRFLVPAPLFACNSEALSPKPSLQPEPEPGKDSQDSEPEEQEAENSTAQPKEWNSHFSLWSTDSVSSASPTVDDDVVNSPTLSALTSDFSDFESPRKHSERFPGQSNASSPDRASATDSQHGIDEVSESFDSHFSRPPQLDSIRLSSFGPSLFLDLQYEEAGPRRQAACFGYGFQGYKLPEDETTSKATLTQSSLQSAPQIQQGPDSPVSQFETLMDDFGFLGESVV